MECSPRSQACCGVVLQTRTVGPRPCFVVQSRQALVAGSWPPTGGCVPAWPGKQTSAGECLVSAARTLQAHWPTGCALAEGQGSLHEGQPKLQLGMWSVATHPPLRLQSKGGIPVPPWVDAQPAGFTFLPVQTLSSLHWA